MSDAVVLPFPSAPELAERYLVKRIKESAELSEFLREELARRIPAALTPIGKFARIALDIPPDLSDLNPVQRAALDTMLRQACDQYAAGFMACLVHAVQGHCMLIEDLRKNGINVVSRDPASRPPSEQ